MTIWKPNIEDFEGPKYQLIADSIQKAIKEGELKADEKLPTHRALADRLKVTTGTVTRAYAEAERRGLVYAVIGSGTFVQGGDSLSKEWRFLEPSQQEHIELHINIPLALERAEMLTDAMQRLSQHPDEINQLLGYQPDVGALGHRQVIAEWLTFGIWQPIPQQIVITNGGQHGIMVALMAMTQPGDVVLCEGLTYPGFTALARQLKLNVKGLDMDLEGITPEALEVACQQYNARVLFCTPTLQNPTTATMSLTRREALLKICKRHQLMVIEDNVSVGLADKGPIPLAALAPQSVVHIGSFSKTLAAGLRVGYCVAPEAIQKRIGAAVKASCWMASPLMVAVVCEWISSGIAKKLIDQQRRELEFRTALARKKFKDFELYSCSGGLHIWLLLPEPWRTDSFVKAAQELGVMVMGVDTFTVNRVGNHYAVRVSLSGVRSRVELESGLDILVKLLREGAQEATFITI